MATSRVPNRYVRRADLIALLDGLFMQQYNITVDYSVHVKDYADLS